MDVRAALPGVRGVQVRDGSRRLGPALGAVAALGVVVAVAGRPILSHLSMGSPVTPAASAPAASSTAAPAGLRGSSGISLGAALADRSDYPTAAGIGMPARTVQVTSAYSAPSVAALRRLQPADLLVVAPSTLPAGLAASIRRLPHVTAAEPVDAATVQVNGQYIQLLGVNPSGFRQFAARPTARSTSLWRRVAGGDIVLSYTMGQQEKLRLGGTVNVAGQRPEVLKVGGYGTVGIGGVEGVVSDAVARTLGMPADNALVISAPKAKLTRLLATIKRRLPRQAAIAQLVIQLPPETLTETAAATAAGAAGAPGPVTGDGSPMTTAQVRAFLKAALSRVGMPYVWGAAGPKEFDCSGLVQWSMRQAGIIMPRVAVDQARTGPQVPISALRPGDLLFFHTDPTAPTYISHVAIYLGNGLMVQAPEPGMDVQIVQAITGGPGFAGAVEVYPGLAAAVAADPAG
jgi:peptidoglycan DL-endopeptidase CwlO